MNLRDRLDKNILLNNEKYIQDKDNSQSVDVFDLFIDSVDRKKMIAELIKMKKNIVFITKNIEDNENILKYFKFLSIGFNSEVVITPNDSMFDKKADIYMISRPTIGEIVKILGYILCYNFNFILGLNLQDNTNILKKIKTLISINFKNISEDSIDVLLSSSNFVFITVDKNSDGQYFISNIDGLEQNDIQNNSVNIQNQDVIAQDSVYESETDKNDSIIDSSKTDMNVSSFGYQNEIDNVSFEDETLQKINDESIETAVESDYNNSELYYIEDYPKDEKISDIENDVVQNDLEILDDKENSVNIPEIYNSMNAAEQDIEYIDLSSEDIVASDETELQTEINENQDIEEVSDVSNDIKKNKYKLLKEKIKNKK